MLRDRAVTIHAAKDLRLDDAELGEIQPSEVRVQMAWGGICGSDLHFYRDGGVGASIVRNPMVLGHELSARVVEIGADVHGISEGDPVAVYPARPCGNCEGCRSGRRQLCSNVQFLGSAARNPHCDGGFRHFLTLRADQIRVISADLPLDIASLTEPLAVALHAIARVGNVQDRAVLVQGSGPIGALLVAALKIKGAGRIFATDLNEFPLGMAKKLGATEVWNASGEMPTEEFDIVFEATGVVAGLASAIQHTKRGGILAQVGIFAPGPVAAPLSLIVSREIDYLGCWRFDGEFDHALVMLTENKDLFAQLITHRFGIEEYLDAFHAAGNRSSASKVLIDLS